MGEIEDRVDKITSARPVKTEVKKIMDKKDTIITIGVIAIGLLVVFGDDIRNIGDINIISDEVEMAPADVQLFLFNDIIGNDSLNVELWVMNVGEGTASDIEVFVRVRDHNGTFLYSEMLQLTALILREYEKCSGIYIVPLGDAEYLTHTIEVEWNGGRNSYSKTTMID